MNKTSTLKKVATRAWRWIGPGGNWKLVLGAMTALAILAYIVSLRLNLAAERQGRAEDATHVAEQRSDALQTASTARQAGNEDRLSARRQIATVNQTKLKGTQDALAANPDWANEPIPPAVLDSLR